MPTNITDPDVIKTPAQAKNSGLSIFLWGHPGTWKTTFCAGLPNPVFLSLAAEGADTALQTFPRVAKYYNDMTKLECKPYLNASMPEHFRVSDPEDMERKVELIVQNHKRWSVQTVIIDSVTVLVDMWINWFLKKKYKHNQKYRGRVSDEGGLFMDIKDWSFLDSYLRNLWVMLSEAGLNRVITALQNDNYSATRQGGEMQLTKIEPMISGRRKLLYAASSDLHLHAVQELVWTSDGKQVARPKFHTKPHRAEVVNVRHRFYDAFSKTEDRLADPEWPDMATPRALWYALHEYIYVG